MMSEILEVAKVVSTELRLRLVVICPYCDHKNAVEEVFSFSGGPIVNHRETDIEMDSIKCWNCHKISFLDEVCRDAYRSTVDEPITDSTSVKSVDGKSAERILANVSFDTDAR